MGFVIAKLPPLCLSCSHLSCPCSALLCSQFQLSVIIVDYISHDSVSALVSFLFLSQFILMVKSAASIGISNAPNSPSVGARFIEYIDSQQ